MQGSCLFSCKWAIPQPRSQAPFSRYRERGKTYSWECQYLQAIKTSLTGPGRVGIIGNTLDEMKSVLNKRYEVSLMRFRHHLWGRYRQEIPWSALLIIHEQWTWTVALIVKKITPTQLPILFFQKRVSMSTWRDTSWLLSELSPHLITSISGNYCAIALLSSSK